MGKKKRPTRREKPRVVTRETPGKLTDVLLALANPEKRQRILRVKVKRSPARPGLLITPTKQQTDG